MLNRLDVDPECDRQTDRRTDGRTDRLKPQPIVLISPLDQIESVDWLLDVLKTPNALLYDSEQIVGYETEIVSLCTGLVHGGLFYGFSRTVILCGDIRTVMVEHEICLLTWTLSHIAHVDNAVKGHSRWPILVPIESPCATSY